MLSAARSYLATVHQMFIMAYTLILFVTGFANNFSTVGLKVWDGFERRG